MKKLILLLTLTLPLLALAAPPTEAPTGWERRLIASVICAESGGEIRVGQEAVYEVLWTRATDRKRSLARVALRPKQFSCLNNRTAASLVLAMSKHKHYRWVHDTLLKFPPLTLHTVHPSMEKLNTNRANHYHATRVSPYWAKGQSGKVIGNHKFYRIK